MKGMIHIQSRTRVRTGSRTRRRGRMRNAKHAHMPVASAMGVSRRNIRGGSKWRKKEIITLSVYSVYIMLSLALSYHLSIVGENFDPLLREGKRGGGDL